MILSLGMRKSVGFGPTQRARMSLSGREKGVSDVACLLEPRRLAVSACHALEQGLQTLRRV